MGDICKRDFALNLVEGKAKEYPGNFFFGNEPTLADVYWWSLRYGNGWVDNDEMFKGKLPWRHKDVLSQYPNSKKVIDGMDALPAGKAVVNWAIADEARGIQVPSILVVQETGFFGMLSVDNFAKVREFNPTATVHPNDVGMNPEAKKSINMVRESIANT